MLFEFKDGVIDKAISSRGKSAQMRDDTADFSSGGDMGRLIAAYDWSATSLGPIDRWPQSLRSAVSLLIHSPVPIVMLWGADGHMIYNDAYSIFAGGRHPDLLGRKVLEAWSEVAEFNANVMRVGLAGGSLSYKDQELTLYRNGVAEQVFMNLDYSPVFDESGEPAGVIAIVVETTQRVVSEAALLESEARFRNLADNAPVMMWVTDTDGNCTYANPRWCEFTGQTLEEARGHGWLAAVHPDDRPKSGSDLLSATRERSNFRSEYRLRDIHGAYRWMMGAASPRFDGNGVFLGYVGSVIDIDERREAEIRLSVSEESLRLATDAADVGTWDLDLTNDILIWPARTKAMFGISPDAPCSMDDFYACLHPEDRDATRAAFTAAIDPAQRHDYAVEYRTIGKEDGVLRWVAARGRGLFDSRGRCVRALGTAIDITARKTTEDQLRIQGEALKSAQDRLAAIFNASSEGLTLCRLIRDSSGAVIDYQVLDTNPGHFRLTGATREQMLAKPVSQVAPPVNQIWFESAEQATKTGQVQTFEIFSPVTGYWLDIHVAPVSGDLFAQTFIDVTARREVEEQRTHFLAEMNHRVKNNFQMVASVLNLQAGKARSAEVRDQLRSAQQRIHLLADLHDSLSAPRNAGDVDFKAYLGAVCQKLRGLIDDPNRVTLSVDADEAYFDSSIAIPLGFVVNELVTNAIKYAFPPPSRGTIQVEFKADPDGYWLKVADGGAGFAEGAAAANSGLGMRLVKAFSGQIGARLEVSQDNGVIYRIFIPTSRALGRA